MEQFNLNDDFWTTLPEMKEMATQEYHTAFSEIRNRYKVGSTSYLYQKYGCPTTAKDMYDKYINDATSTTSMYNGRSEETLWEYAKKYKSNYEKNNTVTRPLVDYYQSLVYNIFYETVKGHEAERLLMDYINTKPNITASTTTAEDDLKYGVDLMLQQDNKQCFIQVKPYSFFASTYARESLTRDRKALQAKYNLTKQEKNTNTLYCIYKRENDKITWAAHTNDKICYRLTELLDDNGNSILGQQDIKWINLEK